VGRILVALIAVLSCGLAPGADAAQTWTPGTNYALITPAQRTNVPAGKVEVLEVFSYACPACNSFQPWVEKLEGSLAPNAQMAYLPASFNPNEDWPVFQRAYLTAQLLGIAARTHHAMYDAVWKTGELAVMDPGTNHLRSPLPSLEAVARWYGRAAMVNPEKFLSTAQSFVVETQVRAADAQITAMQVPGTPCLVVNGKYRVIMDSVHSFDEFVDLINFLVAKETH